MGAEAGSSMDPVDQAVWEMAQAIAKTNRRVQIDKAPDGSSAVYVSALDIPGHYAVAYEAPDRWRLAYQRKAGRSRWQAVAVVATAQEAIRHIETFKPPAN